MFKYFIFISIFLEFFVSAELNDGFTTKIEESLVKSLKFRKTVNVLVEMGAGTDEILARVRSSFDSETPHGVKTQSVYEALKSHSSRSQAPVLNFLSRAAPQLEVKSFWINNYIYVKRANSQTVQQLAGFSQVSRVFEEPTLKLGNFISHDVVRDERVYKLSNLTAETRESEPEWHLKAMNVPQVWNMKGGNRGEGIIVGNIDTGVRWTHEMLRNKWVGLGGNGWLDPENKTAYPEDKYQHGTSITGTLIGDKGMGVAPGAKWLACKGYRDNGEGVASNFMSCCEYMLCPTDNRGRRRDCSKAPHVVSNSWGYAGGDMFNRAINAWYSAGILASFAAGNLGSKCQTMYTPADQSVAIGVGATDKENKLAFFSSRGPSVNGVLKPDVSAPGVSVMTSIAYGDDTYGTVSGTSTACPNVSGVLVLMKAFDRSLNHDRALKILRETSHRWIPSLGETCGGIPDYQYPNNHIGYGIVNAEAAINMLMKGK